MLVTVAETDAVGPLLGITITVCVCEHPLASVTVTVYVPAASAVAVCDVCPLFHK